MIDHFQSNTFVYFVYAADENVYISFVFNTFFHRNFNLLRICHF